MNYVISQIIPAFVGAVIFTVVGMVWYMPKVFGTSWMKLQFGATELPPERKKQAKTAMAGSFILSLIMSYFLRKLLLIFGAATFVEGMQYALWLSIAFIIVPQFNEVLFSGKPVKLFAIGAGYYVVSLVLTGALFGVWV